MSSQSQGVSNKAQPWSGSASSTPQYHPALYGANASTVSQAASFTRSSPTSSMSFTPSSGVAYPTSQSLESHSSHLPPPYPSEEEVLPGDAETHYTMDQLKTSDPNRYAERLAELQGINYTIAIDMSGTMTEDMDNFIKGKTVTRIQAIREFMKVMTKSLMKLGTLNMMTFADSVEIVRDIRDASQAKAIIDQEPDIIAGTYMAEMLQVHTSAVLDQWRKGNRIRDFLLVFGDGEPSDGEDKVKQIIENYAAEICKLGGNDNSVTIAFVQVDEEPDATTFFADLNDNLAQRVATKLKQLGLITKDTFDVVSVRQFKTLRGKNPIHFVSECVHG